MFDSWKNYKSQYGWCEKQFTPTFAAFKLHSPCCVLQSRLTVENRSCIFFIVYKIPTRKTYTCFLVIVCIFYSSNSTELCGVIHEKSVNEWISFMNTFTDQIILYNHHISLFRYSNFVVLWAGVKISYIQSFFCSFLVLQTLNVTISDSPWRRLLPTSSSSHPHQTAFIHWVAAPWRTTGYLPLSCVSITALCTASLSQKLCQIIFVAVLVEAETYCRLISEIFRVETGFYFFSKSWLRRLWTAWSFVLLVYFSFWQSWVLISN